MGPTDPRLISICGGAPDGLGPDVPEDLSTLDDGALGDLLAGLQSTAAGIYDGTADVGDRSAEQVVEEMQRLVDAIESVRAEQAGRTEATAAVEAELAELARRAAGETEPEAAADEPVEDVEPETVDEPETADEPVPVLAAAQPRRVFRRSPAHTPQAASPSPIIAAAEGIGVPMGATMTERQLAEALIHKRRSLAPTSGGEEYVTVARIRGDYPEDRQLGDNESLNGDRIDAVVGRRALVASGGLCAPVTPYYDLQVLATADRPVRDALPSFQATRGGIKFMAPSGLSAITTAVTRITAAQDQTGGTTATKTCQTVTCPSATEVDIAAIAHCLRFGNMGARAWPEQVAQMTALTMAAHARVAETALLDAIATASTAVTASQVAGVVATLLGQILTAAAGLRNRQRMAPDANLRVLLPAWTVDALVADLVRSQFNRFSPDRAGLLALLRTYNVTPTFYIDGPTGGAQVFGTQTAAALLGFPTSVIWFIFPEGSFLFLDGGELNIGLVRDSTLNATNDFQMFGEVFENLAFIGVESLKVTSTICVNGATAGVTTMSGGTLSCPVV